MTIETKSVTLNKSDSVFERAHKILEVCALNPDYSHLKGVVAEALYAYQQLDGLIPRNEPEEGKETQHD